MSIQKYQAFVEITEQGNFTKAAQALGYTQSGISHMINDLEKEWQVTLFERDSSGVRITSEGMILLSFVQRVCSANHRLLTAVKELKGLDTGMIRIGTLSSVATHWLPKIIKRFQEDYPKIEFEFLLGDYTEIEEWVFDGRVDFGFLKLPVRPDLESISLKQDKLLVILPETHPFADCEKFPLEALMQDPFLMLEKSGKSDVSDVFEKHQVSPNIRLITWDDYAIMSMVESGLGISILPELILKRIPYNIRIKELEVPAYRELGVIMKSMKSASHAAKCFLGYLKYREETIF